MIKVAAVLAIALIAGCANVPTKEEEASLDYGAAIEQVDAEKQIKPIFDTILKDPESAKYSFGKVGKGYFRSGFLDGNRLNYGYILDFTVNAKNSYGGYTGAKPYKAIFRNGLPILVYELRKPGVEAPIFDRTMKK